MFEDPGGGSPWRASEPAEWRGIVWTPGGGRKVGSVVQDTAHPVKATDSLEDAKYMAEAKARMLGVLPALIT